MGRGLDADVSFLGGGQGLGLDGRGAITLGIILRRLENATKVQTQCNGRQNTAMQAVLSCLNCKLRCSAALHKLPMKRTCQAGN